MAYKVTVVFEGRNDARTYEDVEFVHAHGALILVSGKAQDKATIIPWHRIAEARYVMDVPVKAPDLPSDKTSPKKGAKVAPKDEDGLSDL